jgi:hypothetical protein
MRCNPVRRVTAAAALVVVGLVALAPSAVAAPYPPQPGAPPTGVLGITVGGGGSPSVCGFAPGTTVTITIGGQPVGNVVSDNNACVTVPVAVVSTTTARVLGLMFGITCGANTLTGTGTGANGSTTTASTTLTVLCATAKSGIVFTGANTTRELEFGGGLFLVGALILIAFRRHEHRRA